MIDPVCCMWHIEHHQATVLICSLHVLTPPSHSLWYSIFLIMHLYSLSHSFTNSLTVTDCLSFPLFLFPLIPLSSSPLSVTLSLPPSFLLSCFCDSAQALLPVYAYAVIGVGAVLFIAVLISLFLLCWCCYYSRKSGKEERLSVCERGEDVVCMQWYTRWCGAFWCNLGYQSVIGSFIDMAL